VDFKNRGAVQEMSPRTLKKRISDSLSQQRIRAFSSVVLSGNQMRHYSKEGDKGLWVE